MKIKKVQNTRIRLTGFVLLILFSAVLLMGLATSCNKPLVIPGVSIGYYIWQDSQGRIYLLWSIDRKENSFAGTIKTDGSFDIVEKSGVEKEDKINESDKEIDFNANLSPDDYADEIIISASNYSFIEFDLKMDGKYDLSRINIGKYLNNPENEIFRIGPDYFKNLKQVPWYKNHPFAEFFRKLFANKYFTFIYIFVLGTIIVELLRITKFASKKKKGLFIGMSYIILLLIEAVFFIMLWYTNGH